MTISTPTSYHVCTAGLPKSNVRPDYNRYYFDPTDALKRPRIVGLLACQRDPYLRELTSEITASRRHVVVPTKGSKATKASKGDKNKAGGAAAAAADGVAEGTQGELWEVEFVDTVLFPEGASGRVWRRGRTNVPGI
jgi:alanyl-tRNA synthetase/misacylated tRNA(Ala) deacylase